MSPEPPEIPDFTMLRPIGRGAYGEVWLARSVTGVFRAVKIVRRDRFEDDRPFEREFAGLKRFEPLSIRQESQVGLLHVGRNDALGFFYYVMELGDDVETGEEIYPDRYQAKTLKELRLRRRCLPATECLDIGLALARALAHLHDHGLVHRDIKPSNVIFVHGVPKLADIGLVTSMDAEHSFVGTEGFIPPEGPGSAGADVFSLGKVLYEISTGRDRKEFPQLPEDLTERPDRRAFLELNEVLLRACDDDPSRRYATAHEMRDDLLLVRAGRSVRRLRLMERRVRFIAEYGIAATLITVFAVAGFLWAMAQTREARRNLVRAEKAETAAIDRLQEARLNWVRAKRLSGHGGQRFESLRVLGELAAMARDTNLLELRNEAIACLLLPDLRPLKDWAKSPEPRAFVFTDTLRAYLTNSPSGDFALLDAGTDQMLARLTVPGPRWRRFFLSRDANLLAVTDSAGSAWTWSLSSPLPKPEPLELPPGDSVVGLAPDDRSVAAKFPDHTLRFVQPISGAESNLIPFSGPRGGLEFNARGNRFLQVSSNEVRIVRTASGERLRTLRLPQFVGEAEWHPDGDRLATVAGNTITIWDAISGRQLASRDAHDNAIVGVKFTPDGNYLITSSWDRTTRFWETQLLRPALEWPASGNGLIVSHDGLRLAFLSWNNSRAHLLESADLSFVQRFVIPPPLRQRYTMRTSFSPDGRFAALTTLSGVFIFQPPHPAPVAHLPSENGPTARFDPDGRTLVTCGLGGVTRWQLDYGPDFKGLRVHSPTPLLEPAPEDVIELHRSTHGRRLWLQTRNHPYVTIDLPPPEEPDGKVAVQRFERWVRDSSPIAVTMDGSLGVSYSPYQPNQVTIQSASPHATITNLSGTGPIRSAAFSPDQQWLAVAFSRETTVFQVADWTVRHRFPHALESEDRFPCAFSQNGRILAAQVDDTSLKLFDTRSGSELCTIPTSRLTTHLQFSPDDAQLAVTAEVGSFQLWNLHSLRKRLSELGLDWPEPTTPSPLVPAPPP